MTAVNPSERGIPAREERSKMVDITAYFDVLVQYKWTFLAVATIVVVTGLAYAFLSRPVFRADIMVQVEEPSGPNNNKMEAGVSSVLDVKPAVTAEMELLRSRKVVGKAVDTLKLDIEAAPRYFPLVGSVIARLSDTYSTPGLFGWGGFAWGRESVEVSQLDVPPTMEGRKIRLTAMADGQYRVRFDTDPATGTGKIGTPLVIKTAQGPATIMVKDFSGLPGAEFVLRKVPRAEAVIKLQDQLMINERGKQSGVIGVSLEGPSPVRAAATLNEIGDAYVSQNTLRKAAEAEKSLEFLEAQLPQLKQQVETAETRYNQMRNQRGTVDLSEESKLLLGQSVQIQSKLQELRQKRQELASRFMPTHPAIELIDSQIASLSSQLGGVSGKIQKLPDVEQNAVRLMRDVKVSTEMLQALLNDAQQLRLMKASKAGTSRLVDTADVPVKPVRPNQPLIAAISVLLGLLGGIGAVIVRNGFDGGIADADDIERHTGMTVYATIPLSPLAVEGVEKDPTKSLLAHEHPDEPAVEALRSFRTTLQFALAGSTNRTVVITGPAPALGKSFLSANFAAVSATGGRRVVLVDADLRRGCLHERFGVKRTPGLTELLMGAPLDNVLQRDVTPGLDFISTGMEPPHTADVLLSPCMDSLFEQLRARYDLVIIDTPPVLAAADAAILGAKAGVVFVVARSEKTTAAELIASQRAIRQAGAEVKGVLFNGLKVDGRWYRSNQYFGKYRYMREYGPLQKPQKKQA